MQGADRYALRCASKVRARIAETDIETRVRVWKEQ